jgi:predicted permease
MRIDAMGDVRWAWRQTTRRPLAALGAAATLAGAIGAVTVALGLATAVLWRPLPLADADRVVLVWEESGAAGEREPSRVTAGRFADWRDHSTSFESLALFGAAGFSLEDADGVSSIRGVRVSANYFQTIGVSPMVGRGFSPDDEVPGQHFVVVISHDLWQQRFGGRADVVGQSMRLSGQPYTIVGVAPPIVLPAWPVNPATVTLDPEARRLWVPIARTPELDANARAHVFGVVGRLAGGVALTRAETELNRLASPTNPDPHGARVRPIRGELVRSAQQPLLVLLGSAIAVLLVACTNLASLRAASFESRRSELATRASLGANIGQLVRLLTTETLLVALAGGAAGLLLARAALTRLPALLPSGVPLLTPPELDVWTMLAGIVLAVGAGLVMAAWPTLRLLSEGPMPRGVTSQPRPRVYRVLVAAQVAVAVALVSSAILLGRSLWSVQATEPGFRVDGVVSAEVSLPADRYATREAIVDLEDRLISSAASRPGVAGVAIAYDHPLEANWTDAYALLGDDTARRDASQAQLRIVSPTYFEALGVDVLDGRIFGEADGPEAPGVVVVNEQFARTMAGGVIGRQIESQPARLTWGEAAPTGFTIVGVVEDERFRGLEEPSEPAMYMSTRQFPQRGFALLIATTAGAEATLTDVRSMVRAVEPRASVDAPALLATLLANQLASRRVTTSVIGGFAVLTLLLAGLGLYGLLSLFVSSRTREIGVRVALGADRRRVAGRVVGESLVHVATGLAAGLLLALGTARLIEGMLVGVRGSDPLTLAVVGVALALVALAASLIPAVRASRVDPVVALRGDG